MAKYMPEPVKAMKIYGGIAREFTGRELLNYPFKKYGHSQKPCLVIAYDKQALDILHFL
jgi:hypothetical protein